MSGNKIKLKVCITGGAGFIGSHLADRLLDEGYNTVVLDNLNNGSLDNLQYALKHSNFKFIKGDVVNYKDCLKATDGVEVVYHLACLGVRHSIGNPLENHRVNAGGILNVLEACRKNKVKRFFYISSSEIYGYVKYFPIKEETIPIPSTIYGASKLAGEYYTNVYHKSYGLNSTIFRLFNNYGPRAHYEEETGELIPRTIVSILYNKQPIIFGDGSNSRDFFYVKDTAHALTTFIREPRLKGVIMNIGAGTELKVKGVIKKILDLMDRKSLGIKYLEFRPADVPRLWADVSKFRKFNFKPEYSFERGLLETIDYYKTLAKKKNLYSQIKIKNW